MKKISNWFRSYLGEFTLYCIAFIGTVLFAKYSNWIWSNIPLFIVIIIGTAYTLYEMAYAWVINPIRAWQQKQADKNKVQ